MLDQVRDAGLPVDLEVVGAPYPLAPSIDLTAYRIVQEALTNTLRHAEATRAAVTAELRARILTVGISDRGPAPDGLPRPRGAAPGPARPATGLAAPGPGLGFGLAGIAERVASCGGSLTVGPTEADGFAVTARLPAL